MVAGRAINNGGMILRWVRDKICHYGGSALETLDIDPYDLMTMKAEHVEAGADGSSACLALRANGHLIGIQNCGACSSVSPSITAGLI